MALTSHLIIKSAPAPGRNHQTYFSRYKNPSILLIAAARLTVLCIVMFLGLAVMPPCIAGTGHSQMDELIEAKVAQAKRYQDQGEWAQALETFSQAIEIAQKDLAPPKTELDEANPQMADLLDRIADVFLTRHALLDRMNRDTDRYDKQLCDFVLIYERAEWIRTKAYKTPFHPLIAQTMDRMAALWRQCHPPMAVNYYQASIKSNENIYGANHIEVAQACERYARYLQWTMADFKGARTQYKKALKMRESLFGKSHLKTIQSLPDLAWATYFCGDKQLANSLIRRGVEAVQTTLISDHAEVADIHHSLALLLDTAEDYGQARNHLQKAAEIRKKIFGPQHPMLGKTLKDLATVCMNQKDRNRAYVYYQQALTILEKAYGPEHPELEEVVVELIDFLEEEKAQARILKLKAQHAQILKKKL